MKLAYFCRLQPAFNTSRFVGRILMHLSDPWWVITPGPLLAAVTKVRINSNGGCSCPCNSCFKDAEAATGGVL